MASLNNILQAVYKPLDSTEDMRIYREAQNNKYSGRLGAAIKEFEEAERIRRDTQNILTRAKIELRKRNAGRARASREAMGGMFG